MPPTAAFLLAAASALYGGARHTRRSRRWNPRSTAERRDIRNARRAKKARRRAVQAARRVQRGRQ